MKVIQIDTDMYSGYICPISKEKILFELDECELSTPEEITERTIVQGFLVQEGDCFMEAGCEPYLSRWNKAWSEAEEKAKQNDDLLDLNEFIKHYEDDDLIAIEVSEFGMGSGPASLNFYHLVRQQDWDKAQLIPAK